MIVQLKDVTFTYLHFGRPAIHDVNLELEPGSISALVGAVGSGKTTLLLTLDGLIPEAVPGVLEGSIIVDGTDVRKVQAVQMAEHMGLVFDDPSLQIVGLTVEEDMAFGPANLGLTALQIQERVAEGLQKVHLIGLNKRSPRKMSGGQQQLLAVGGVLAMHPRFVAMDEPVAMLDPVGKAEVLHSVQEMRDKLGLTVLISESGTDIESVCEFADKIWLMHKGKVVGSGRAGQVFADRALIEELKVKAPQVTRLAWEMGLKLPDGRVPTTTAEAYELVAPTLVGKRVTASLPAESQPSLGDPVVKVSGCCHTYPASPPVQALCGIELTIRRGEMVAILGQNGSGKTTLAYHLVGVLRPTNPDAVIEVDGVNVVKAPLEETIQHINYVFQNPANQLFCETFDAEVRYGPERLGLPKDEVDKRVLEALSAVGLEKLLKEDTVGISRAGEAMLSLASVLSMRPQILIVDEPTGGLDWESGNKVMQILADLNRQGRTIIIITHDMELAARYCGRLVVMKDGLVMMDGTPREVFSQPDKLRGARLYPPQITQLAQRLASFGMPADVLTVEEFLSLLPAT